MAFCHLLLSNPVGSPQEERKVEVEEERKLIPTCKVSGWRWDLNPWPTASAMRAYQIATI
jgi:hypothetical protein